MSNKAKTNLQTILACAVLIAAGWCFYNIYAWGTLSVTHSAPWVDAARGRQIGSDTAAIAQSATTSAAVDLAGFSVVGLFIPALTSANLTFTVAPSATGTFQTVKTVAGDAFTVTATTGDFAVSSDELGDLAAYSHIKIVSSVTQAAARTFTWYVKE